MLITRAMLRKPLQHNLHSHKNICTDILTEQNSQPIENKLKMLPIRTKSYGKGLFSPWNTQVISDHRLRITSGHPSDQDGQIQISVLESTFL